MASSIPVYDPRGAVETAPMTMAPRVSRLFAAKASIATDVRTNVRTDAETGNAM